MRIFEGRILSGQRLERKNNPNVPRNPDTTLLQGLTPAIPEGTAGNQERSFDKCFLSPMLDSEEKLRTFD